MGEVMVDQGVGTETAAEAVCSRVLGVLKSIAQGRLESTEEITGIYSDVETLVKRAETAGPRLAGLNVEVSPYLAHLKKMRDIEREISML